MNVAIAAFALLLFHLVGLASGRVTVRDGLGWDGAMYAQMVTGRLSDGSANTAVRPLIVLAARVPHRLGLDVVQSFVLVNTVAAFVLYLVAAMLLESRGVQTAPRAVVVANLALTIAVSKMFGFYPVLIDLGAMAVITTAFYLVITDRFRAAALACLLAAASREFGLAAALFGMHRAIRLRRWSEAMLFAPSLLIPVLIRLPALGLVPAGGQPLSLARLAGNLELWLYLPFVTAFAYFAVTLLGGLTVLLVLRMRTVLQRLRAEPELATFAGFVGAATATGDSDIPRYLVFVLPVAIVLVAACLSDLTADGQRSVLAVVTLITVVTQRPFQAMTTDSYFVDWFPLYRVPAGQQVPPEIFITWMPRLVSLALLLVAAFFVLRHAAQQRALPA